MEIRTVELPSKIGDFSFPIKVYRNRLRKDNESYSPDIECEVTDTKKLQNIIIKTIESK